MVYGLFSVNVFNGVALLYGSVDCMIIFLFNHCLQNSNSLNSGAVVIDIDPRMRVAAI